MRMDTACRTAWTATLALVCLGIVACDPGVSQDPGTPRTSRAEVGVQVAADPAARLQAMVDAWFEAYLEMNPWYATSISDHRFDDRLEIDISEDYRLQLGDLCERYLRQAESIERDLLSPGDVVTLDVFERELRLDLMRLEFPGHLLPFDHYNSTPNSFAELGSGEGIQPFATVRDYDNFLARIDDFVLWTEVAIENMREGARRGVVQPRFAVELMIDQMRQFVVDRAEDSLFYRPLNSFPDAVPQGERQRLASAYQDAIMEQLVPAYSGLADFLEADYLPAARDSVGYGDLPGGDAWYDFLVARHTTTDLTADHIYQIGLDEVARILDEMDRVRRQVGYEGDLAAFLLYMKTDPRFQWDSGDEMLDGYRAVEAEVAAGMPRLFGVFPRAGFEIRPVEAFRAATAANASYRSPSEDGTRPGVFYLNTEELSRHVRWNTQTLFLHEAIPGHHFQGSLAQENPGLPRFRRFGFVTAYSEGWALYSEDLGMELGMFTDPHQYFGKLNDEMLRAMRLVVDTGIHRRGWSRDQAADYMRRNSSLPEGEILTEVDRYVAIAGQALSYKIGQRQIRVLRSEASRVLGEDFDLRSWHDFVLGLGDVPMDVLERANNAWLERRRGG
ncbi:MAG: DUF885 domain-containing protein [Chromatiales bacterium]|nr:DUF885 domain-containing protein [Chromatiales bacterium]